MDDNFLENFVKGLNISGESQQRDHDNNSMEELSYWREYFNNEPSFKCPKDHAIVIAYDLGRDFSSRHLKELFVTFGEILGDVAAICKIRVERADSGMATRVGCCIYKSVESASRCVQSFNQSQMNIKTLMVTVDSPMIVQQTAMMALAVSFHCENHEGVNPGELRTSDIKLAIENYKTFLRFFKIVV